MTASIYPPPASGSWLDVDLQALCDNAASLRARAGVPLIAMVKADGYGLGAVAVARALGAAFADPAFRAEHTQFAGDLLWGLGIATLAEAKVLRDAGCTARILCCTPLLPAEFVDAIALDVRPSLHTPAAIEYWVAQRGGAWHLPIDTGMARAGVRWDEVAALRPALSQALQAGRAPEGMFTHFHSAEVEDGSRETQEARFADAGSMLREMLPASLLIHTDNSAAIAMRGVAVRSAATLVRPGIAIYGAQQLATLALQQTVHLRARIVDVRDVFVGEGVGYGATYVAAGMRRIATVPVGYGDGYRRHLSNRGEGLLRGVRIPVVGRVSMDMTTLDVTGVPAVVGDVITLIGADGGQLLTTDEVAARGGLSPYELLVGLRLRLPRLYRDLAGMRDRDASRPTAAYPPLRLA